MQLSPFFRWQIFTQFFCAQPHSLLAVAWMSAAQLPEQAQRAGRQQTRGNTIRGACPDLSVVGGSGERPSLIKGPAASHTGQISIKYRLKRICRGAQSTSDPEADAFLSLPSASSRSESFYSFALATGLCGPGPFPCTRAAMLSLTTNRPQKSQDPITMVGPFHVISVLMIESLREVHRPSLCL
jgi:hypothetical protein